MLHWSLPPLTAQWVRRLAHPTLPDVVVVTAEMQGRRADMEDAMAVRFDAAHSFVGVFDGHGGDKTSTFVARDLVRRVMALDDPTVSARLDECVEATDDAWAVACDALASVDSDMDIADPAIATWAARQPPLPRFLTDSDGWHDGSTSLFAVLRHDTYTVHVANAGDCRALLIRASTTHDAAAADADAAADAADVLAAPPAAATFDVVSRDHTPSVDSERARIEAVPRGFVSNAENDALLGPARVMGHLSVSRGFGDFAFKNALETPAAAQMVSVVPEHTADVALRPGDTLLLACDGVFDVLSNQQIADFVTRGLASVARHAASASPAASGESRVVVVDDDDDDDGADDADPPLRPRECRTLDHVVSALLLHVVVDGGSRDNTSAILMHRRRAPRAPSPLVDASDRRRYQPPLRRHVVRAHTSSLVDEWRAKTTTFAARVCEYVNE